MIFDYHTLKLIWWVFVGIIIIGFALTDGYDLGTEILLPVVGKTEIERRAMLHSVEAVWEGHLVWFVLAGGATFAAWPLVYANVFSGLYAALLLVLFTMFLRPVGFNYRNKFSTPRWRIGWDTALFIGGFVPALVFGMAFGNLFVGLPFHFDTDLRIFNEISFWQLFNPFALLCGAVSVVMLALHGATWLLLTTEGVVQKRAGQTAKRLSPILIALFAVGGAWVAFGLEGYQITAMPDTNAIINPVDKTVVKAKGAWLANYTTYRWTLVAPILAFVGAATVFFSSYHARIAFIGSSITVLGIIATAGLSLFPFVVPSSSHPAHSLTLWDCVSSHRTLQLMFWATVILLPIVMAYTAWVFRVLHGKTSAEGLQQEQHY